MKENSSQQIRGFMPSIEKELLKVLWKIWANEESFTGQEDGGEAEMASTPLRNGR